MTDQVSKVRGDVSVPREPTDAMIEAFKEMLEAVDDGCMTSNKELLAKLISHLSAAPIEQPCETVPVAGGEVDNSPKGVKLEVFEIVCRDRDRLQAEVASLDRELDQKADWSTAQIKVIHGLNDEVAALQYDCKVANSVINALQADLTKARELLAGMVEYADGLLAETNNAWSRAGRCADDDVHEDVDYIEAVKFLAHQSAPAAKCAQCGAATVETCNDNGCAFLENGNGAPAAKGDL